MAGAALEASARAAAWSVKEPSSRFGHLIKICSCVKKGARSDCTGDSSSFVDAEALLRKGRITGDDCDIFW